MATLLIDRRFQNCTDAELKQAYQMLSGILVHHGVKTWDKMPSYYRGRMEACYAEFQRRGVQLRLFED